MWCPDSLSPRVRVRVRVCLVGDLEEGGKEGLVPLSTTRWQCCQGSICYGLVLPSSLQRKGRHKVEFERKAWCLSID